jgi:hypothetical protein
MARGKGYVPQPIDTERASLDDGLLPLLELLARHAHDVWAQQRLADGWQHGPQRDDTRKLHPCLVPYEELPESEKQYDRNAVLGNLKAILALGYQITPVGKGETRLRHLHRAVAEEG